jgi:hypothetical protein
MYRSSLLLLACALLAPAGVRQIYVVDRADVLAGQPQGSAGPYERIIARARFTIDPRAAANQIIRDVALAQTNAAGLIEFDADLFVLKPRDPAKGNGTVLFEVSNRGGKGMLNRFCFAKSSALPETGEEFGDRWLLEEGYTLVWLGWQSDVAAQEGRLRRDPVPYRGDALPAPGLVRSEFIPEAPAAVMPLGDMGHIPIPVRRAIRLTFRSGASLARTEIPPSQWKVERGSVALPAGFKPGMVYEFTYEGDSPDLTGLGPAGVRDIIAFLKYGGNDISLLGDQRRYIKRAIGFGISQSGRFLRHFLYDGFNADERGRKVFDGVFVDVAGAGRGSFNHRYAQPSRDGNPFRNIFYPTDLFPYTDLPHKDPVTGVEAGLLDRARAASVVPKIVYTNNSYEYWGRAASLIHITPDGKSDAALPPESRVYFYAGVQHGVGSLPLRKGTTQFTLNPVDHRPAQRAVLAALQAWLKDNVEPPASVYPRLAANELAPPDKLRFPVPGVKVPRYPRRGWRLDFGPDFASKGIVTIEPPALGEPFPLLAPAVDSDGIDVGGIRLPMVAVPLGTFTGWNLRSPEIGAPGQMSNFLGSFFPFPRTEAERSRSKDPRPAIEQRYKSREDFQARVRQSAEALVRQRFLLERDAGRAVSSAMALWDALIH